MHRLPVVPGMESMTDATSEEVRSVTRSGQVSETVVEAVSEATGVDPLELEPLYSVVDADALNSMFRPSVGSPPTSLELQFSMAGCEVVVHGDGEVVVTPPEETEERPGAIAPRDD